MFKSVLIAEDHESTSISVQKTLADLGVPHTDYVYYCDDALLRIRKGLQNDEPYDLLITDLSFEADHREQKIPGGEALIAAVKQAQPNLKVLIFSAENKPGVIKSLFNVGVNGYVCKARNDAQELKLAIHNIYKNKQHFPEQLMQIVEMKNAYEFTNFDITIITLLSQGMNQKDFPTYLQKNGIKPTGLSTIEKRLSDIKKLLNFTSNWQLVAFCKDMGIL